MYANPHIKMLFVFLLICGFGALESFAQKAVLKHSYTFDDGTPIDVVGNADGVLKGGKIEDGKYIATAEGQYIELPAKLIKINSYTSLSLEAFIIAGKDNNVNTMLAYFGNKTETRGTDYIFLSPKNSGYTRSSISCKEYVTPWTTLTTTKCNTLEDGLPHHIVTTFDNKTLKLYVDGLLVSSQSNKAFPKNILSNIGEQLAYLAKSGYTNDSTWLGAIDAFNIYEGILDAETIEKSAHEYLPEKVIAVRSQLTKLIPTESLITKKRLDSLSMGVLLNRDWSYHSGDNLLWAQKDYSDNNWPEVRPFVNLNVDNINGAPWDGIGWFRKKFTIDSTLFNQPVGIMMNQIAASEIYLNGKLIKSFGQIGSDTIQEKLYNPNIPFTTVFDTSTVQVIAIRYSNLKAQQYYKKYGKSAKNISFNLRIGLMNNFIESSIKDNTFSTALVAMFATFFLAFTLLNLLMFFFYSKGKENLYFALYTGSAALNFGFLLQTNLSNWISSTTYIIEILALLVVTLLFASYIFFLYTIFYKKMPRQFWLILAVGTLISISTLTPLRSKLDYVFVIIPFIILLTLEGLRVTVSAVIRKKRNAFVIGTGVAIFSISIFVVTSTVLFSSNISNFLAIILLFSGTFSVPVAMLIYLARERAKTKTDLENQIVQVQQLSEKAIEQEKREAELRVENTRKEVELQKAAELKSAYHNLEIAHEELKATQKQLIQSEKMASLGELTAGIAHEIQNPLNFVNNFSDLNKELVDELKEELATGNTQFANEIADDIKENEIKINHHGKRAESIVKGMLLHSRGSSGQKESTDINALCDEYLRLSYHGFRAKDNSFNADFKLEADESIPKIEVVPQDIGRVLLNLLNNAFQAVNEKAKSSSVDYNPEVIVSTKQKPPSGGLGGQVEIRVSDNGPGIPDNIKEKIFQPFFTTKPTGQGTGLGLSLSYDIVKAHGGELSMETKEGEGSIFKIVI